MEVLKESVFLGDPEREQATWQACLDVNEVGHLLVAHQPRLAADSTAALQSAAPTAISSKCDSSR